MLLWEAIIPMSKLVFVWLQCCTSSFPYRTKVWVYVLNASKRLFIAKLSRFAYPSCLYPRLMSLNQLAMLSFAQLHPRNFKDPPFALYKKTKVKSFGALAYLSMLRFQHAKLIYDTSIWHILVTINHSILLAFLITESTNLALGSGHRFFTLEQLLFAAEVAWLPEGRPKFRSTRV